MSRSYHVNYTHLRGYTATQVDEMAKDPDSILQQLAEKGSTKRRLKKVRKIIKQLESR
jgi:hypothetical protein